MFGGRIFFTPPTFQFSPAKASPCNPLEGTLNTAAHITLDSSFSPFSSFPLAFSLLHRLPPPPLQCSPLIKPRNMERPSWDRRVLFLSFSEYFFPLLREALMSSPSPPPRPLSRFFPFFQTFFPVIEKLAFFSSSPSLSFSRNPIVY